MHSWLLLPPRHQPVSSRADTHQGVPRAQPHPSATHNCVCTHTHPHPPPHTHPFPARRSQGLCGDHLSTGGGLLPPPPLSLPPVLGPSRCLSIPSANQSAPVGPRSLLPSSPSPSPPTVCLSAASSVLCLLSATASPARPHPLSAGSHHSPTSLPAQPHPLICLPRPSVCLSICPHYVLPPPSARPLSALSGPHPSLPRQPRPARLSPPGGSQLPVCQSVRQPIHPSVCRPIHHATATGPHSPPRASSLTGPPAAPLGQPRSGCVRMNTPVHIRRSLLDL